VNELNANNEVILEGHVITFFVVALIGGVTIGLLPISVVYIIMIIGFILIIFISITLPTYKVRFVLLQGQIIINGKNSNVIIW